MMMGVSQWRFAPMMIVFVAAVAHARSSYISPSIIVAVIVATAAAVVVVVVGREYHSREEL